MKKDKDVSERGNNDVMKEDKKRKDMKKDKDVIEEDKNKERR